MGDIVWLKDYKGGGTMNNIVEEHNNIKRPTIYDVADYFVKRGIEDGIKMTPLKLQKLTFYTKALSLLNDDELLKEEEFEAWVHGPANIILYYRYLGISRNAMIWNYSKRYNESIFTPKQLQILNKIYNNLAVREGKILEDKTHKENPWKNARKGYEPFENSNQVITNESIKDYYKNESMILT